MNTFLKSVLTSLLITCSVSIGLSFLLWKYIPFFQTFIVSFTVQIIAFFIINSAIIKFLEIKQEKILNERLDILSKQVALIKCPCGKNTFEAPIYINEDNVFTCEKCNNEVRVEVSLTPVLLTLPVDIDESLSKLQELSKRIRENPDNSDI